MAKNTRKMGKGDAAAICMLFVFLLVVVVWGSLTWTEGASVPMSVHGWIALTLGVVFSLVIGCGLMALMFYSDRSGHDIVATPNVFRDSGEIEKIDRISGTDQTS
jgi:hypothetical protein